MEYRNRRADSLTAVADSLQRNGEDSGRIESLRMRARNSRAIARTVIRRRDECSRGSTYLGAIHSVYGAARMAIRLPCDTTGLRDRRISPRPSTKLATRCSRRPNATSC